MLVDSINTDDLIKSTFFIIKMVESMCFSKFSRVRMFCSYDRSKLVPESTGSGFHKV